MYVYKLRECRPVVTHHRLEALGLKPIYTWNIPTIENSPRNSQYIVCGYGIYVYLVRYVIGVIGGGGCRAGGMGPGLFG